MAGAAGPAPATGAGFKAPVLAAPVTGGPGWDPELNRQSAKQHFQTENALAGDKETLETAEGRANYQNFIRENYKEPKAYTGLRRAGVLGGVSEAGFMGGERGRLSGEFQAQAGQVNANLLRTENAINRKAAITAAGYGEGQAILGEEASKKYLAEQERLAPQTQPPPATGAAAGYPGATAAVNAAFPGGPNQQRAYIKAAANGVSYAEFMANWNAGRPTATGNYAQRARGGAVSAGKSYVVGERGPERFTPRQNGLISPLRARAGKKAARR